MLQRRPTRCCVFSLGEGNLIAACKDTVSWRDTKKAEELLKQKDKQMVQSAW